MKIKDEKFQGGVKKQDSLFLVIEEERYSLPYGKTKGVKNKKIPKIVYRA